MEPEPNRIVDYGHWRTGELLYSLPFYSVDQDRGRPYRAGDSYVTYADFLLRYPSGVVE